ncbi:MAG: SDR family oxidoreductase [Clostridia bacterium]|nr:SDR family oxidoreductase [Clostridia bacterium]
MFQGEFNGKTLLATGGASGMGLLLCEEFLKYGGNAVLVDINADALALHVQRLNERYAGKVIGVPCDVRDYKQVCNACDEAVKAFNSIDVLVNLAGGAEIRMLGVAGDLEFCDVPIEVYDWGLDVNLRAQMYFDHAVFKQMRAQMSGVIVNIGSIAGMEGCPRNIAYSTSKSGAVGGLTMSVALAGAKYNVRCVALSPGPVLTRKAMSNMKTLLGRAGEPIELVNMILFLASSHGAFITGENILMDGGRILMRDKVHGDNNKYGEK